MTKETFLLCKTIREGLFTRVKCQSFSAWWVPWLFVFSFKILYVQFFKATQCLTPDFHSSVLPNHQKPNHVVIRQLLSSSGGKKKSSSSHLAMLCLQKTPILNKCQTARARLQRSYLYFEAGHCYCTAPYKAHTTYWKRANAINNTGAIHRWNAGRGWIQPDLEDILPTGYLQSHRQPVRMPAQETQIHIKQSGEIIKAYASHPLWPLSGSNTHLPNSTLQSSPSVRSSFASEDGRLKHQNPQVTLQHVCFLSFSKNSFRDIINTHKVLFKKTLIWTSE